MKWNETATRFARPVRWLVAWFNGALLPIEAAGIRAGDRTYGHRVIGQRKPLVVRNYESYRSGLKRAGVLVDPASRRQVIEQQLRQICSRAAVELNADESLMDQAVFTTEWPCALLGSFKSNISACRRNFDDLCERASGILFGAGQNNWEARAAFYRGGEQPAQRYVVDSSRKRACARSQIGRCQVFSTRIAGHGWKTE